MVGIERVDGELDKNRTRSSRLGDGQGFPDSRHNLPDGPYGGTELAQWLEERHLVNILQRSSALCQLMERLDIEAEKSSDEV